MFLVVKVLVSSLCSSLFCKWCMFIYSYTCLLLSYIGCAGSVGISLTGRVIYIFCACDSAVWSAGPVQFYLGAVLERMAGLYRFFLFLWLCCSGFGTVEMLMGGGLSFFFLSSVCCQFSWRLDVCGRILFFCNVDFLW